MASPHAAVIIYLAHMQRTRSLRPACTRPTPDLKRHLQEGSEKVKGTHLLESRVCWPSCPEWVLFLPKHIHTYSVYSNIFNAIRHYSAAKMAHTERDTFTFFPHSTSCDEGITGHFRSRAHSGRTFMAFGRDTFRENLHLITFNLIPVACIHANSCWSHSCIF